MTEKRTDSGAGKTVHAGPVTALADIFVRFSGFPPEHVSARNRAAVENLVAGTLKQCASLDMILPAFPFKSTNRRIKVLSSVPDFGEAAALKTLSALCDALNVHVPARLRIVSDGHVFNDLLGIPDDTVDLYFDRLQSMNASPRIEFMRLKDFLGKGSAEDHRRILMRDFAENAEDLDLRIKDCQNDRALYRGMKRFLQEEFPKEASESRAAFERRSGALAKKVVLRSDAYSRLLEARLPGIFRLSIHPRPDWDAKIPIRLLPSPDRWATPWHNVAVHDPVRNATTLMHRRDAERRGYALEFKDGHPWRYIGTEDNRRKMPQVIYKIDVQKRRHAFEYHNGQPWYERSLY